MPEMCGAQPPFSMASLISMVQLLFGTHTGSQAKGKKSLADILKEMPGQIEAHEIEPACGLPAHGADVNARDQEGKTVLSYAEFENHPDLVVELEGAGGKE